ncbi:MAG: hypothetical protein J7507_16125, partial [Pseudoxanthomonas sp.]|nr:hypothetical protein [Pseudoxanthomonas sp.]
MPRKQVILGPAQRSAPCARLIRAAVPRRRINLVPARRSTAGARMTCAACRASKSSSPFEQLAIESVKRSQAAQA